MFSLTNILLLGSGLLSLTSAVHLPAYAALERNLDIRQAVTTPTSSLATNGGSPTTSATSADSSSIANDTNSVPSACEQICLSTYNLLDVDDDTVFCDPTNYTAYVNCFNCLVANGEPDADAIDAQQSLDSLTQTCLSANFTLASTGTITASSTTFGPFTTFPDDAATDTAVTTTTSSGVTTGTASTTVGARTATTGTATGSGATIAADGSTKTTFAAQSASASASALVSASASKTGGVGMNAVSGRWGVLGGVMAVFGLLLAQ